MSSAHQSSICYSNAIYHREAEDTFERSQARQMAVFTRELLRDFWLQNGVTAVAQSAALMSPEVVKSKADNLLRMTKTRALARLRSAA